MSAAEELRRIQLSQEATRTEGERLRAENRRLREVIADILDAEYGAECQECAIVQSGSELRRRAEELLGR